MFVNSDIFDLKRIGRFRDIDWRENLIGAVVVHGTQWPGYQVAAQFMLEAARRTGIAEEMTCAGYTRRGDDRQREIKPKSFEKLSRGGLKGAINAVDVLLKGEREAEGTQSGVIWFGGLAELRRHLVRTATGPRYIEDYPYPAFNADFQYPLPDRSPDKAIELLRFAVEALGAEYGYYFVRDSLCGPSGYPYGLSPPMDHSPYCKSEGIEISGWADFIGEGRLWTSDWPIFRDLFEVNLISERHTCKPIPGLGYLLEWIGAQSGRGRLEDLDQGRWLWILTDAEMVEVRPRLNKAGILYSCLERVYRDVPQGAADAQRLFDAQKVNWAPWVSDARRDYPGRFSS